MIRQAVILAGGLGTRISEESILKPKPMIEVGGKPILLHIMEFYAKSGVDNFVICAGYKAHVIKEYFCNYHLHHSDVTFSTRSSEMLLHSKIEHDWRVTVTDTGVESQTGERIRRALEYCDDQFFLTYGDGLSDIDLDALSARHRQFNGAVTVSSVLNPSRFGVLSIDANGLVTDFAEKPDSLVDRISGGYFCCTKAKVIPYFLGDNPVWEKDCLPQMADSGELQAFEHNGFWHPMDTLRDKVYLESLVEGGKAPWLEI